MMVKVMVCTGPSKQDLAYSRPAMSENSIWKMPGLQREMCQEIVPGKLSGE
jgi:hypothetical protein